jgi:hypothetical protein
MVDVIEAAVDEGERPKGLALVDLVRFPCADSKRPLTSRGFYAAGHHDYRGWPLVGVPTGEANGFDVLDIDPRSGGDQWLKANQDCIPDTQMHTTRSRGLHFLFRHQAGIRNRTNVFPGVDVRGIGGYVIWWPEAGLEWVDHPLAAWPEWLLEHVRARRPRAKTAQPKCSQPDNPRAAWRDPTANYYARRASILAVVERAMPGNRNAALHWSACRMADMIIEQHGTHPAFAQQRRGAMRLARELLTGACRLNGLLAEAPEEVRSTIRSAFKRLQP